MVSVRPLGGEVGFGADWGRCEGKFAGALLGFDVGRMSSLVRMHIHEMNQWKSESSRDQKWESSQRQLRRR